MAEGIGVTRAHVAVVVLSYNGREDTLACLDSLAASTWSPLSVIVVDNGSSDGTAEAMAERHPDVKLVASAENLGWAGGNNLGLREVLAGDAGYALLLNNDVLMEAGVIASLVEHAERLPDAGAVCPLMHYADPPDLIWYAGAWFDPRRGYNGRQVGMRERDSGQYDAVRETGRASGAAMLVKREMIERVGLLDHDLFLQVEDVDWSLRMREAGYRIWVVPAGRVEHKVSADTGGEDSPALAYYGMRNRLTVCARHAPLRGIAGARREAMALAAHALHARRGDAPLQNLRGVLAGWRDYRRGRLGPRPERTA